MNELQIAEKFRNRKYFTIGDVGEIIREETFVVRGVIEKECPWTYPKKRYNNGNRKFTVKNLDAIIKVHTLRRLGASYKAIRAAHAGKYLERLLECWLMLARNAK